MHERVWKKLGPELDYSEITSKYHTGKAAGNTQYNNKKKLNHQTMSNYVKILTTKEQVCCTLYKLLQYQLDVSTQYYNFP